MPTLIDGYNLLHVTGVFTEQTGPGSLERLHAAFLDYLQELIDPEEVPRTTVVFDAKGRRATTRRQLQHGPITVHYAARHEDADTLLAELIQQNHSPRKLVVVSSDHQVQRAARRRRAPVMDSEVWYAEQLRRRKLRSAPAADQGERPSFESPEQIALEELARPFPPDYLAAIEREFAREKKRR